jgi:high-affinity Fe2+/Pb2+ permease
MQKMIVQWLEIIALIGFGLFVLGSAISGAQVNGGLGFLLGAVAGFFFGVVIFGALFVLLEINKNIRAMRAQMEQNAGQAAPIGRAGAQAAE